MFIKLISEKRSYLREWKLFGIEAYLYVFTEKQFFQYIC